MSQSGILLGNEIHENYRKGTIHISPFKIRNIGPNSYDVTLNDTLKLYHLEDEFDFLDMKKANKTYTQKIPEEGLVLVPGILYIGSTNEEIGSDNYVPGYEGRSSLARLGVNSHQTAGFGDIGFKSKWTLEISVIHPVKIYPNIRIGQIYFLNVDQTKIKKHYLYDGKYKDQNGAQESKSYLDFNLI